MSENDAQIDVNGTGDAIGDEFDELMGEDYDSSTAVLLYGLVAFGINVTSLLIYMLFDDKAWIMAAKNFLHSHQKAWWGVGWSWLLLSFFDNELTRAIFTFAIMWSFMGPFVWNWVDWTDFLIDNIGSDDIWFWIWLAIHAAVNLIEILWVALVVPSAYDWIENAPFYNPEAEEELFEDEEEEVEEEEEEF